MSTESPAQFDAAREIPDEYDFFCEACAYSLAGLTGDRCPECGAPFDPKELPFARIPWLHRRRLGNIKAYLRTVVMVCFRPGRFARELCRPVRISATDARSFRLTTIWLLTAISALIPAAIWTYLIIESRFRFVRPSVSDILFGTFAILAGAAGVHMFLRLASDMPTFIWKGLASTARSELAPIHHYAAAPLALLPIPMLLAAYLFYLSLNVNPSLASIYLTCINGCLWLPALGIWWVAIVLMNVSTDPTPGRLGLMAIYLPVHWLTMFTVSGLLFGAFVEFEHFMFALAHATLIFFR